MIEYMDLPADAQVYYREVEREVIGEIYHTDPVSSQIKLKTFVSTSKGRNRKRKQLKEITLIKYGHEFHEPHRFNFWIAGLELLGDVEDVESKLQEIVLGNQAYNLNSLKATLRDREYGK